MSDDTPEPSESNESAAPDSTTVSDDTPEGAEEPGNGLQGAFEDGGGHTVLLLCGFGQFVWYQGPGSGQIVVGVIICGLSWHARQ